MKEKNSFLLNKMASWCPRPIAIKAHLLFCFVFHICFQSWWLSFPNLMETLSRGSPVPWEPALCLKGFTMPLHATHHRAQPKGPYQPAARSQTHSSSPGRKQVREWILSVSYNSNGTWNVAGPSKQVNFAIQEYDVEQIGSVNSTKLWRSQKCFDGLYSGTKTM